MQKLECGQPKRTKPVRAMKSATNRDAEILTTDYRMTADRGLEPKLINPARAMKSAVKSRMWIGELQPPSPRRCALPLSPQERGKWRTPREVTGAALIPALCAAAISPGDGGAARGHCGLQNARNDEQAKPVRNGRRTKLSRARSDHLKANQGKSSQIKPKHFLKRPIKMTNGAFNRRQRRGEPEGRMRSLALCAANGVSRGKQS
jgi:hypothetical protein